MTPKVRGVILVLVAPLVWFLISLIPIKGAFFLPFLAFLVAGAIALYGVFILTSGWADKRRR